MTDPWARRKLRFGFKLGGRVGMDAYGPSHGGNTLSYAVVELVPSIFASGEERAATEDEQVAALLRQFQNIRDRRPGDEGGIRLYRYASVNSFASSRASREGMTRQDHDDRIERVAARLRMAGLDVDIETVP